MKNTIQNISQLVRGILSNEVDGNPVRTLCMLVYVALKSKSACINEWAYKIAAIKDQAYENARFVLWRFLSKSAFDVTDAYRAITRSILSRVDGEIVACMDWTDVYVFKVLAISVTLPLLGRTLPLYIKAIRKDATENEMTHMEQELLKLFFEGLDEHTRSRVIILADRGFAKVELMRFISSNARYIIRLPKTSFVLIDNKWVDLKCLSIDTYEGKQYKNVLLTKEHRYAINLVIRKARPEKVNHDDDPDWILATNCDFDDSNEICRRYSHRMKIEEMFRDLKSAGFNIEDTLCRDEHTMNKIILILALAYVVVIQWRAMYVPACVTRWVTTDKNRRGKNRNIEEHSAFQISIRIFESLTDQTGLTCEEVEYIWAFLLIRARTRNRIMSSVRG